MPQSSTAYAAARIYGRSKGGLNAARAERLISAQGLEEAHRVLTEFGLLSADGARDAEAIANEQLRTACALIRQITPSQEATDCFFLRYDGMNLKMLIKARMLGKPADHLSACGTLAVPTLRHAVADRRYSALPAPLASALEGLEKALAVADDPLRIDLTVDQAIYTLIGQKLREVKSPVIRHYFTARVDMLNAIILLRARRLGKDAAFIKGLLLPGGSISWQGWESAYKAPEKVAALLSPYGDKVKAAAALASQDSAKLPLLEKAMEDALIRPFKAFRQSVYRIEPIIGYWLGVEREAAAVRLILAGHANGFDPDAIRERLGELYGD